MCGLPDGRPHGGAARELYGAAYASYDSYSARQFNATDAPTVWRKAALTYTSSHMAPRQIGLYTNARARLNASSTRYLIWSPLEPSTLNHRPRRGDARHAWSGYCIERRRPSRRRSVDVAAAPRSPTCWTPGQGGGGDMPRTLHCRRPCQFTSSPASASRSPLPGRR